ncbi:type VI secretion system baseplate subunit TssE [Xanthobacter sp. TB0139]|uniref:type VI secretion system baseplate subunit TssE n=1 Tax=Xanthobacter sp. TB0139 TaxID=3459178 RepID=UPI00403A78B4
MPPLRMSTTQTTAGLSGGKSPSSGSSDGDASPFQRLSLLDRLLDDEDRSFIQALRHGIRRDLEALLNTEQCLLSWPKSLSELDSSILNFGIMCFGTTNMSTQEHRTAVVERIGAIIRTWEPRLHHLNVQAIPNGDPTDRTLHLRIEAQVTTYAAPVAMVFDTVIEPTGNTMVSLTSARRE